MFGRRIKNERFSRPRLWSRVLYEDLNHRLQNYRRYSAKGIQPLLETGFSSTKFSSTNTPSTKPLAPNQKSCLNDIFFWFTRAGAHRYTQVKIIKSRVGRAIAILRVATLNPQFWRIGGLQRSSYPPYETAGRITGMLANYINAAMEQAVYEIIEEEGTYWGEIPDFQGVWAHHLTLEGCRRELRDALGDWIALRLQLNLSIPTIANIDLNHLSNPYEAHYA